MPQASDELRAKFSGSMEEATSYLTSRGFELTPRFTWKVPKDHVWAERDNDAIDYLCAEWDFGGTDPHGNV